MSDKKILIVEDEPVVRTVCVAVLRKYGFDSIPTTNGLEGLKAYQERHEEICLILSDITMPFMSGIELSRKLFEMHSHANVILMSGKSICDLIPDEIRRLCSVLQKPFTPERLIEAVKKCLKYDNEHHGSAVQN